jgi:protein-disulfide isomerase
VLIEFEDFQCPACQRHALGTQPELDKRFVETGQVRWVVKHFPLGIHPRAAVAAAAAQCAGDQSKFWPMHRALFERMEQWVAADEPAVVLASIATELGLEKTRFITCLGSRQALEPALRDLYDGQSLGVRSVPSFVMFHGGAPLVLVGTRSLDQFAAVMQRLVDNAKTEVTPAAVREGAGR